MSQGCDTEVPAITGVATRKRSRALSHTPVSSSPATSTSLAPVASTSTAILNIPESATATSENGRAQRKRVRSSIAPASSGKSETVVAPATPINVPTEISTPITQTQEVDPLRFEPKRIIFGTLHCKPTSYLNVQPDGLMLSVQTHSDEKAEILLPFSTISEYTVCEAPYLPLIIIRNAGAFGDVVRKAIPTLRRTDESLSAPVYDPCSADKCHCYMMLEMKDASSLCQLISKMMQNNVNQNISPDRILVPKSIGLEEAKKKLSSAQCVLFKWKELQLGTWKSKTCMDCTINMSGTRIKFKVNNGVGNDIILVVHFNEINSLMLCVAQSNPVLFIRATDVFGWAARERLSLATTFQQGRDFYNPDSPETRFKYVTFKLEKQGLSRDVWQQMYDVCGYRFYTIDHISSRAASEILHKLIYQPINCKSVRVGANELDEIRAVTIHFDSICVCGCMLDSVVTMNICIADIKEISFCLHEKHPVLFVKTSTAISDTLKRNMAARSADVFFDPTSKDIKTQYIVIELAENMAEELLKRIYHTLQSVLIKFNDRINVPKDQRANFVKVLSRKRSEELVAKIKEPLLAKECTCGKKEDIKLKEEVKQYVQSMTQKHGCDAMEKIASRAVDLQKKILCSVCLDRDCQVVFSCGHMICERCDQSLRKCHICRMKILRRVRIFI